MEITALPIGELSSLWAVGDLVQAQPVHAADHRAADAPALATVAFADRAARAEPHLRHGGARAHHRIRGRRGGNAHVRGRAGRVFRGARGVRIHDHRLRHGVVVGVRDRDHRGIWRLLAGHLPRQDHCGGADVHRHRVDRYCDGHAGLVDRGSGQSGDGSREDAREKEVAKEAAQEAIATSANPEIDLLREEVRELTATVAGLRTELERR